MAAQLSAAMMIEFWDRRFSAPGFAYGASPNAWLAGSISRLEPGALLLPGEGEGRNAVWAAEQGWAVTAFDLSRVARDKALGLAGARGVQLDYRLASLTDPWPVRPGSFDAVGLVFVHVPSAIRPVVHRAALLACRPGGRVLLQGFTPRQLGRGTGGPKDGDMLYDPDDLARDFSGGEIVQLEERVEELAEGVYHRGPASVVCAEIRRPR